MSDKALTHCSDFAVVVNKENELSATVDEIRAIMCAEKLRVQRRLVV